MLRDFTYIEDLVKSLYSLISKPPEEKKNINSVILSPDESWAPFKIFNIGNSNPTPLMDYIEAIEESLGKKAVLRAVKKIPKRNSARQQAQLTEELSSMKPEEIDYNDLQFLQKKLRENVDNLGSENVQAINNIERELVKSIRASGYPRFATTECKTGLDRGQGQLGSQRMIYQSAVAFMF